MEKWKACVRTFCHAVQKIAKDGLAALQKAWTAFVTSIRTLVTGFCRDVRQLWQTLCDQLQRLLRLWFS